MTKDRATSAELVAALDQLLAQTRHLTRRGRTAFGSGDLDSQVEQLASCQVVIQLQAVVEDIPADIAETLSHLPLAAVRGMRNRLAHGWGHRLSPVVADDGCGPARVHRRGAPGAHDNIPVAPSPDRPQVTPVACTGQ